MSNNIKHFDNLRHFSKSIYEYAEAVVKMCYVKKVL